MRLITVLSLSPFPHFTFSPMVVSPVILEGQHARLEPLSSEHHAALCEVGLDEDLWRWTTYCVTSAEEMRRYIETALEEQARGVALPFATIEKQQFSVKRVRSAMK